MKKNIFLILIIACALSLTSCKKGWLDAKPNKSLVVPSTVEDYQALLDNTTLMNNRQPTLGEVGADDFYLSYVKWQALSRAQERNAFVWAKDIFQGESGTDWIAAYSRILNENIVLDGIEKVTPSSQNAWNNVKGSALFYRAFDFFNLAQEFCKPFNQTTATSDLGIVLRMTSNVNQVSVRSTVQQTYDQVINDLNTACRLLPDVPLVPTRPSKPAAYSLLARIYLSMENYAKALLYSDSCLQLFNSLNPYSLVTNSNTPFSPRFFSEVIFHSRLQNIASLLTSRLIVDSTLYRSYDANDLRKTLFFRTISGNITFKGSYDGSGVFFCGLATDEMYLIRAECYARKGNTVTAMNNLNTLLQTRWQTGTFVPYTASNADDALNTILIERRKELVFRGQRWTDLRRLNKDPRFAVTLIRVLNGETYTLPPNDLKYVLPIPDNEIRINNVQQNPR